MAGRSVGRVREVASRLGVPALVFDLVSDIQASLRGFSGIINLAGPYSVTSQPLISAAIEAKLHYVDVANELTAHQLAWELNDRACAQSVGVVAGAGMGTWCGEYLAHALTQELGGAPNSVTLIALPTGSTRRTTGASASLEAVFSRGGFRLHSGQVTRISDDDRMHLLENWTGFQSAVAVASGDLMAISRSLNVDEVNSLAAMSGTRRTRLTHQASLPSLGPRECEGGRTGVTANGEASSVSERYLAEVSSADGRKARGVLKAGSGTALSGALAIEVARTIVAAGHVGTRTAFQVLGADGLPSDMEVAVRVLR